MKQLLFFLLSEETELHTSVCFSVCIVMYRYTSCLHSFLRFSLMKSCWGKKHPEILFRPDHNVTHTFRDNVSMSCALWDHYCLIGIHCGSVLFPVIFLK